MDDQTGTAIIGAGRMGQGIALALVAQGVHVALLSRGRRTLETPLVHYSGTWEEGIFSAETVLLAVPDDAIAFVVQSLVERGAIEPRHVILHLSGLLDHSVLEPLTFTGAALGSFHPLQSVARPREAAARLRDSYVGIEGQPRAMVSAEALAARLGLRPVRLPRGAKTAYHIAATLVSNYTMGLLGLAQRLVIQQGVPEVLAAKMYVPLLEGSVDNVGAMGLPAALTGVIRRGDVHSIEAHLAALGIEERRVYCLVGREVLRLARSAGLDEERANRIERMLVDAGSR